MSNSLDPDQAQRFVWPDLGPECLKLLSADDTNLNVYMNWKWNLTGSKVIKCFHAQLS